MLRSTGGRDDSRPPPLESRAGHDAVRHGEEGEQHAIDEDGIPGRTARARIHRLRDEQIADEPDRIQERGEEDEIARHAIGQGKNRPILTRPWVRVSSTSPRTPRRRMPAAYPRALRASLWPLCMSEKPSPSSAAQRRGVVAADIEIAAPLRPVVGEAGDDEMAALRATSAGPDSTYFLRSAASVRKWNTARSCQTSKVPTS